MEAYDDLDAYNGDVEHDMWVDYDYDVNTDELSDDFDDSDDYWIGGERLRDAAEGETPSLPVKSRISLNLHLEG